MGNQLSRHGEAPAKVRFNSPPPVRTRRVVPKRPPARERPTPCRGGEARGLSRWPAPPGRGPQPAPSPCAASSMSGLVTESFPPKSELHSDRRSSILLGMSSEVALMP